MSQLFIVATPIGNLKDITLRAIETLQKADLILCEDTRVTQKLLKSYKIFTKTLSYHQHSPQKRRDFILDLLKRGKNLALVCDAGTPGLLDPGQKIIEEALQELGEKVKITPIPGASALMSAISVAGIPLHRFVFLGFPPAKRKRNQFFERLFQHQCPVIFYESPYRILKTLENLKEKGLALKGVEPEIIVCNELTKKFEKVIRGKVERAISKLKETPMRGEFVVIVRGLTKEQR